MDVIKNKHYIKYKRYQMEINDRIKIDNAGTYKIEAMTEKAIMIKIYHDNTFNSERDNLWLPISQMFFDYSEDNKFDFINPGKEDKSYSIHHVDFPLWLLKKNNLI